MNLFDLTGKVAVVTGASGGLGEDAAKAYAQYGADVAVLARRKDKLEALASEIEKTGRKALAVECDVTKEEEISHAVDKILSVYGKMDILLNNAGVAMMGSVDNTAEEDWDKVMNVNIKGYYLMCKYVIPSMKSRQYGKIVNISSVNALIGDKPPLMQRHSYNASKAAVLGLTVGMAVTYGADNITVNAICPGLFESEMTQNTLFKDQNFMEMYEKVNPTGRAGRKGELNGTIIYLSSDASSYLTGHYITVDGGLTVV